MSRFSTPDFFVDPYPTYEELRGEPACWAEDLGGWVLTGYADDAVVAANMSSDDKSATKPDCRLGDIPTVRRRNDTRAAPP